MKKLSAYKRAQMTYNRIVEERKRRREQREVDKQVGEEMRQRMEEALKRRTRRGQPKLDSVMEVLVEKIKRRMGKEE